MSGKVSSYLKKVEGNRAVKEARRRKEELLNELEEEWEEVYERQMQITYVLIGRLTCRVHSISMLTVPQEEQCGGDNSQVLEG